MAAVEPLLSKANAHLLAFGFAATYVGSLYMSKNARLSFSKNNATKTAQKQQARDDPAVIRARLLAVTIATLINCFALQLVIWHFVGRERDQSFWIALNITLSRLGINLTPPEFPFQFNAEAIRWIRPHLITPVLFLGSLCAKALMGELPFQRFWFWSDVWGTVSSWIGIRNYILAPFTEEVVFRACVISAYALAGASRKLMIIGAPMWFGLAHIHHAWEMYNRYGRTSAAAKRAIFSSIFQLAYTTLFGAFCSYLFLRTSSLAPVVSSHVFCNIMGLPMIKSEIEESRGKGIYIITAYIIGIVLFVTLLGSWTHVEGALYWNDSLRGAFQDILGGKI